MTGAYNDIQPDVDNKKDNRFLIPKISISGVNISQNGYAKQKKIFNDDGGPLNIDFREGFDKDGKIQTGQYYK